MKINIYDMSWSADTTKILNSSTSAAFRGMLTQCWACQNVWTYHYPLASRYECRLYMTADIPCDSCIKVVKWYSLVQEIYQNSLNHTSLKNYHKNSKQRKAACTLQKIPSSNLMSDMLYPMHANTTLVSANKPKFVQCLQRISKLGFSLGRCIQGERQFCWVYTSTYFIVVITPPCRNYTLTDGSNTFSRTNRGDGAVTNKKQQIVETILDWIDCLYNDIHRHFSTHWI